MSRKKTAHAIQQEIAREIEHRLGTIFTGVRKTGQLELEAVEMLVRSAMHQTGAIARREQQDIKRAVQLDLPMVMGEPVPTLYVQMDGTSVPVVKQETAKSQGKLDGLPAHTRTRPTTSKAASLRRFRRY